MAQIQDNKRLIQEAEDTKRRGRKSKVTIKNEEKRKNKNSMILN